MSRHLRWDIAERGVKVFAFGFLSVWLTLGNANFDTLFVQENLEAGVVALALSVAANVGLGRVGDNKDTASVVSR